MTAAKRCHSCGSAALDNFYRVDDIPVHSVLLMRTAEEARAYPRGSLELSFCDDCGFIQNSIFDATVHEYSTRYEETQGFSPTFNRFARKLAQHLVDRYKIHDKDVLEIGCGKGEFLVLLCELGPNRGIGLDPAYVPERTDSEAASRIRFIQDFYSEKYTHLAADFVCCRHTLEHIQPTREFLQTVRRSIGDRFETVVSFELPAVERVLKDQAFWDIYYEHCSYFSCGSLARLFRRCGFEVLDVYTEYDDQYLLVDARPVDQPSTTVHDHEETLEELRADLALFKQRCPVKLQEWRDELSRCAAQGQRVALWGSGSKAVSFLTTLGITDEIQQVTDINPYRHGMFMPATGHEIVPPDALKAQAPDVVIMMNGIYREEISADLRSMGLSPRLLSLD